MINLDLLVYCNEMTNIYNNVNIEKNKKIILRPGLLQFLQELKQIYELILFSNNTFDYSKILKSFENNEKFFEYFLSNKQIKFEKDGSITNLDCLGRDIKNIIILDKGQSLLKLNKENIIFVKPFYGDVNNDRNLLKNLIEILKKINYDMEDSGDIRVSLIKHKLEIFTKITTNVI
jgi:TFIIF-interacting CTD phosphatase-like protein